MLAVYDFTFVFISGGYHLLYFSALSTLHVILLFDYRNWMILSRVYLVLSESMKNRNASDACFFRSDIRWLLVCINIDRALLRSIKSKFSFFFHYISSFLSSTFFMFISYSMLFHPKIISFDFISYKNVQHVTNYR